MNLVEKTNSNWLSKEQKEIIRKQFFPQSASDIDMKYCIEVAKSFNLNPILKQIFFIERKAQANGQWISKIEPLAGRDSFLTLAHRSGQFAGIKSECLLKKEPRLADGKWQEVDELVAVATVYRKDVQEPFIVEVSFNEYAQYKTNGELNTFWKTKPKTMLKKVAESQALRKAFDITGLYSIDEMPENENHSNKKPKEENKQDIDLNQIQALEVEIE